MTILDRLALTIGEEIDRQDPKCQSVLNLTQISQAALKVVCDALREPSEEMIGAMGFPLTGQTDLPPSCWVAPDEITKALRALADHLQGEGK